MYECRVGGFNSGRIVGFNIRTINVEGVTCYYKKAAYTKLSQVGSIT